MIFHWERLLQVVHTNAGVKSDETTRVKTECEGRQECKFAPSPCFFGIKNCLGHSQTNIKFACNNGLLNEHHKYAVNVRTTGRPNIWQIESGNTRLKSGANLPKKNGGKYKVYTAGGNIVRKAGIVRRNYIKNRFKGRFNWQRQKWSAPQHHGYRRHHQIGGFRRKHQRFRG